MSEVKIHTVNSEDLSPRIVGEGFCTDVVRYNDYAAMEAKCAALAAENAALKEDYRTTPALRSKGWPKTPATDAFLAEVRNEAGARAVELFAQTLGSPYSVRDEKCYEDGFTRAIEVVRDAQAPRFAAQLRQGGAA
ncbi:hypothetical protein [Siccibacter colletis]|uniref:Ead/Ea22-like family protein n=1 Tax=Siccibacter colletis TaxID=1505757 RepID=A0ABY6JCW8_9ENTR|nr:hypothetical protein [Siccibacter colletis]UYU30303.1 hypothetical protein KFZ77_10360 [Siccibacter colletis]